ncbi:MAG: alpha-amylase family glycosyl hydrolase, partial [Chitinophagaceae bacterium]|nr:alpha-amylase family glycosyl hydrolase [Chitinophagaceae bacterium]
MKALYIYFFLISTVSHYECYAQSTQIVILNPSTATAEDSVEIIYDPSLNTTSSSILGTNTPLSTAATSIYMHSGVVTVSNGTKWSNIIGNWGKDDGIGKMRKITGTNKWRIKILPRAYYNVPEGTNIFRLAMVFRNAEGTAEGKGNLGTFTGGQVLANGDIYVNLTINNYVTITSPTSSIIFQTGIDSVRFEGVAISSSGAVPSQISLFISQDGGAFQNVRVRTNTNTITFRKYVSSSAKFTVRIEAVYAGNIVVVGIQSFSINVKPVTPILPLPAGVKKGINYHPQDPTRATLVLHTPKKTNQARAKKFVYVVGDFSNWETNNTFFMNQTADSSYFWIELRNLIPGKEYVFQYWVDGNIKIGDPYADKIVDTYNDIQTTDTLFRSSRIPQEYEIASVLQTNQTAFAWESTENTRTKPRKQDLIIYELLIRDFSPEHSFQSVIDSLPYLKRLGINAIQLMPIMEFEGNESWGYNPSYYFAPDKYYGSKNDLKLLIQEAHKQGMVVILDMVLNHAFGQCALSRLYWDEANNRPSAENPWFNTFAPHAYGLGSDFNHESTYTQDFVDEVNKYWLQEFHFDGYRFDLTKGFTNTSSSGSNDNANYDQSRINILKRMANKIWEHSPGAYVILEHFADASEENVLASEGMLLWSNATYTYGDILLGSTSGNTNFVQNNTRVNYMESHDEERLMYKAKASSAGNGSYRVNDLNIGLNRVKTLATLFYTVPGPKMLWQFQELGYDISINYNGRVGNKPLVWGNNSLQYYQNAERQKLYKTIAALFKLINENRTAFTEGYFSSTTTGDFRTISINHENLSVAIVGNVYLQETTGNIPFARTGTWYDYFTRETKTVNSLNGNSITLAPGEFHIYVNKQTVTFPEPGLVDVFKRQVITLSPAKLIPEDSVTIYFDESRSVTPCGLLPINSQYAKDIYLHSGILTQNITPTTNTTWEHDDEWVNIREGSRGLMTNLGNGIWRTKLGPSLKEYYNVGGDTVIYKIAMIFRNSEVYGPPKNDTPEARGIPGDTIGGTGLVPLIRPGDTNSRCNPSDACTARCGNIWMNITPPDASVLIQSP